MTENLELPSALRREWRNVQKDLNTIPALESYAANIQKRGMSVSDAVSIESHFPGLLLPKAPTTFSYTSTNRNVEYSQEAIADKMRSIKGRAREYLAKLLQWIKDRCTVILRTIKSGRLKQGVAQLNALSNKGNTIDLSKALKAIGPEGISQIDENALMDRISTLIDNKVTITDIENNIPRSNVNGMSVCGALSKLQGNDPEVFLVRDTVKYTIEPYVTRRISALKLMSASGITEQRVNQLIIDMTKDTEKLLEDISSNKLARPDYVTIFRDYTNDQTVSELSTIAANIEQAISKFKQDSSNPNNLPDELADPVTRGTRILADALANILTKINQSVNNAVTLINFCTFIVKLTDPEVIKNYVRTNSF